MKFINRLFQPKKKVIFNSEKKSNIPNLLHGDILDISLMENSLVNNLVGTRETKPSLISKLLNRGQYKLAISKSMDYYRICSPIYNGIDILASESSTIPPLIYNTNSDQYIDIHPLLLLLKNPNQFQTYSQFFYETISFYKITGNNYWVASLSNLDKKPLEIINLEPQLVNINNGSDGFVENYTYTSSNKVIKFYRTEDFRYLNKDETLELFHLKTFNPDKSSNLGLSPLTSIFYEIEQYISGNVHNLSLLERGGRPSGALVTDKNLTDDQRKNLQQQLQLVFGGALNSGRLGLFENGLKYQQFSQNNKDMDFSELKNKITVTIYNALRIPLPLVNPERMTMSNMESAKFNLYDNAIIPLISDIFSSLTKFLIPKYESINEHLILSFNEGDIIALEPRRNEKLKTLKEVGVNTPNEIRAIAGYEPLDEGGDQLYIPINLQSIAEDVDTINPQDIPTEIGDKFIELMQNKFDKNGERMYSDEEIELLRDKYGL